MKQFEYVVLLLLLGLRTIFLEPLEHPTVDTL